MAAVNTPISGYTNTNEIAAAINGTSSNVKEPKKPIARMHRGSGHLRCITHRTAECHNLRKQSANEQSVSSSSVSVLRERKPSDNLFIVKPAMHSLRSAGAQCKMWSRRRLQSKNGHGAHFMVYAQPFVTLTLFTRTPTSSRCTYEQKDNGDGGFTKALK